MLANWAQTRKNVLRAPNINARDRVSISSSTTAMGRERSGTGIKATSELRAYQDRATSETQESRGPYKRSSTARLPFIYTRHLIDSDKVVLARVILGEWQEPQLPCLTTVPAEYRL